jgi:penicillin-binding protein 2
MIRIVLVVALLLLSACTTVSAPPTAIPATPRLLSPTLSLDAAQQIAGDFLNRWAAGDYAGMYALLHLKSRDATPQSEFIESYTDAEQTLTVTPNGKRYRLTNSIQSGSGAQIAYEMVFQTRLFGEITERNRLLTLEESGGEWRVAWSVGDVFPEFRDGAALYLESQAPNRGNIYDRNGIALADQTRVLIAVTLLTQSYPTNAPDLCFAALARVFPTRDSATLSRLYSPFTGRSQAYEIGILPNERFQTEKTALEAVCTLRYRAIPTRHYPLNSLGSHLVGYVGRIPAEQVSEYIAKGYNPDQLVGLDGVERYYEPTLAGRGGAILTLRKNGVILRTVSSSPPIPPQSVYLTIDAKLQHILENALKEAWSSSTNYFYSAKGGAAILMEVRTGEILAMASYPDFDLNLLHPYTTVKDANPAIQALLNDPRTPTLNRATLGAYPLGSVFKIVSMAAAADSGKFSMGSLVTCTGIWDGASIGDRYRTDWIYTESKGQHGTINLKQSLMGSCDPYFWRIGWTLNTADPALLLNYAKRMGFGAPTGIKGISETAGQLPDPATYQQLYGRKWTGSDSLDFVIGQGSMLTTPLQAVRMTAAVSLDGILLEPLLIKKIGLINQPSFEAKPIRSGDMSLKAGVLDGVRDAMCGVVTDRTLGTAYFVFKDFKGAVICGKTGTAESGQARPHAWFGAYAGKSADKPEIALIAIVENSYEGSFMAAPLVKRMVEAYYGLPLTAWPEWWGSQRLQLNNALPIPPLLPPSAAKP